MSKILCVGIGGGFGAICRYLLLLFFSLFVTTSTPIAIMFTNLVGCCILGMISEYFHSIVPYHDTMYALLSVGVIGGFTSFSTFSLEAVNIFESGRTYTALGYVLFALVVCFSGVYLGKTFIKFLFI